MIDTNDTQRLKRVSESCERSSPLLPVSSVNHLSLVVSDCDRSLKFYKTLLGFQEITRPKSFDFDGYWLEKENLALHLVQAPRRQARPNRRAIHTKSNHISLICDTSMGDVERILDSVGILYKKETWTEPTGAILEQVFFHDPDGFLIEGEVKKTRIMMIPPALTPPSIPPEGMKLFFTIFPMHVSIQEQILKKLQQR